MPKEGKIKHAKYEAPKRKNPAPTKAKQKEQDMTARLAKASRTRTPGWNENSHQNKLQQSIARSVVQRDLDKQSKKKRTKARSSSKRGVNQK